MRGKKIQDDLDISINESEHTPVPTFLQRLKKTFMAMLMGIVFAQVMLFAFREGSVVIYFWFYPEWFIPYLIACAVLGWVYGDKFVQTLGKKSEDWWNIWREWR